MKNKKGISASRKAQASMMEYIIMTFFMMIIIAFIIFMFLGIQFTSITSESSKQKTDRSLSLLKTLSSSQIFAVSSQAEKNPVFSAKKLTAAVLSEDFCEMAERLYGSSWTMELMIIGETGSHATADCTSSNYGSCGIWSLCQPPGEAEEAIIREIPVNIYMENTGRTEAALMKVTTYG